MARTARIVLPDTPHHITQRGNRGEPVFFEKADYQNYIETLKEQCETHGVQIWTYSLLQNQIHLIAVPQEEKALANAIGEAHRRYTVYINNKQNWSGHLFQNRFFSYPMDEAGLLKAAHFIETLPVSAGIVPKADSYIWSSAKAHAKDRDNPLVSQKILPNLISDWASFLEMPTNGQEFSAIERHLKTGRPRGSDAFLDSVEAQTGRSVRPQKRGRKPKTQAA